MSLVTRSYPNFPAAKRNIEIKAKFNTFKEFMERMQIAKNLTNSEGVLITQKDLFFKTNSGRLKLRFIKGEKAELIQYERPDVSGPKLSKFHRITVDDPDTLEQILIKTNGLSNVVEKRRVLFLFDGHRIHLDKVENLGNFIEFEIILNPRQKIEEGTELVQKLLTKFAITDDMLMAHSYADLLEFYHDIKNLHKPPKCATTTVGTPFDENAELFVNDSNEMDYTQKTCKI